MQRSFTKKFSPFSDFLASFPIIFSSSPRKLGSRPTTPGTQDPAEELERENRKEAPTLVTCSKKNSKNQTKEFFFGAKFLFYFGRFFILRARVKDRGA